MNNASNTKSIRIEQQKGRLSTEEIDRIVKEAEKFKAEDAAKRERVDAKNQLESVLYQSIQQLGEKVPSIKEYCQTQLDWLEENQDASTETLQGKMKEVQDFIQAEVAKNGGAPGAPGGAPEANDMPADLRTGPIEDIKHLNKHILLKRKYGLLMEQLVS